MHLASAVRATYVRRVSRRQKSLHNSVESYSIRIGIDLRSALDPILSPYHRALLLAPHRQFYAGVPEASIRHPVDQLADLLSGECVVVVVCNYMFAEDLTRFSTFSTCTSGFATHVEARSSPGCWIITQCSVFGVKFKLYGRVTLMPAVNRGLMAAWQ